jgi:hypothetical protein
MTPRFTLWLLLLTVVSGAPAALAAQTSEGASQPTRARERSAAGEARRTVAGADFEKQGVVVGDQVPDLDVVTLDGTPTQLSKLWQEKPTLLVTASLTCGRARERQPWVNEVAKKYGDRLNVAVLYTIEAHPVIDPSPYAEYSPELENPEHPGERPGGNRGEEGFPRRQPADPEAREALAREYRDLFSIEGPVVIDGMGNDGWEALGAGPNMGFLIDRSGKVSVKHGWLDDVTMERSIGYFLQEQAGR